MNLHSISLKRLLLYWLAMFTVSYVSSLFLYTLFQITRYPIVFIALQVVTPLSILVFSWLYFRGVLENDWAMRILVMVAWIALMLLGSAILMQPVMGYPWTAALTPNILRGQAINAAAVLVGGWVARR